MKLDIPEYIPLKVCTDELLKKLRKAGFKTNGYEGSLEGILTDKGFGLPAVCEDGDGFCFTINRKYTGIYLNYPDSLAQEILKLHELNLL